MLHDAEFHASDVLQEDVLPRGAGLHGEKSAEGAAVDKSLVGADKNPVSAGGVVKASVPSKKNASEKSGEKASVNVREIVGGISVLTARAASNAERQRKRAWRGVKKFILSVSDG